MGKRTNTCWYLILLGQLCDEEKWQQTLNSIVLSLGRFVRDSWLLEIEFRSLVTAVTPGVFSSPSVRVTQRGFNE